MVIWSEPDFVPLLTQMGRAYSRDAGVNVDVVGMSLEQMQVELVVRAPQGLGPDLFVAPNSGVGQLLSQGLIAELDLGETQAGFLPVAVSAFLDSNRGYGMPLAGSNLALLRNTELAPKRPTTVERMLKVGRKLVAQKKADVPLAMPIGAQGDAQSWYPLYSAAGGYLYGAKPDGSYDPDDLGVGKSGSVQAGRILAELVAADDVDPKLSRQQAVAMFTAGRAGFLIAGPTEAAAARVAGIKLAVDPVPGFADTPEFTAAAPAGFTGVLLSAFARDRQAATELVTGAMATTAFMDAAAKVRPSYPAWQESLERAAADADVAAFAAFGQTSGALPNLVAMPVTWQQLSEAQVAIISGTAPQTAMIAARKGILAAQGGG